MPSLATHQPVSKTALRALKSVIAHKGLENLKTASDLCTTEKIHNVVPRIIQRHIYEAFSQTATELYF